MYSSTRSIGQRMPPGAQKGAHYSAPMHHGTPRRRRLACVPRLPLLALAAAVLLALVRPTPVAHAAEHPEADAREAEQQLQAVKAEIERVTREGSAERVERDRLTRELRAAELSVGKLREALAEVRRESSASAH